MELNSIYPLHFQNSIIFLSNGNRDLSVNRIIGYFERSISKNVRDRHFNC